MMKLIGEKLRQYDLNRTVELIPKHGLTVETVLFYKNSPEPLVVAHREEDGKIIADIPNIFLKAFGTLSMEVHMIDEEGHLVSKQASFYVSKREMPEGYVYEETPVLKLGSGGSGGVTSWNDLPDRPFGYVAPQEVALLAETTFTEFQYIENVGYCAWQDIAIDDRLLDPFWDDPTRCMKVVYNGAVYENPPRNGTQEIGAQELRSDGAGLDFSEYPFNIRLDSNGVEFVCAGDQDTVTMAIYDITPKKVPVPFSYQEIPDIDLEALGVPAVFTGETVTHEIEFPTEEAYRDYVEKVRHGIVRVTFRSEEEVDFGSGSWRETLRHTAVVPLVVCAAGEEAYVGVIAHPGYWGEQAMATFYLRFNDRTVTIKFVTSVYGFTT